MIAATTDAIISRKLETCIHEASHAVVAACLGMKVISADCIATEGRLGACTYHRGNSVVNIFAAILAGPIGAWEGRGRRGKMLPSGSDSDWVSAEKFFATCEDDEGKPKPARLQDVPEYQEAIALALSTIAENFGAISHIASYLLTHETISGALVREIVRQHELKKAS